MSHTVHLLSDSAMTMSDWLARAEPLHRVLRPNLPADYETYLRLMFAEGAMMAVLHEKEIPKALAVFRVLHTTFNGRRFYVDDLVTVEGERGRGYGAGLLRWCEDEARTRSCDTFALDSGVQRAAAHRFYFRHGMSIMAFGFDKRLQ